MNVQGAAYCQQIQIHRKLNNELNLTFGTFSDPKYYPDRMSPNFSDQLGAWHGCWP